MPVRHAFLVLALVAPPLAASLEAQYPRTVKPGTRVEFSPACQAGSCPTIRGAVLGATPDSISVKVDGQPRTWGRSEIQWLRVGRNRHGARTGAIIGGSVLGASTGLFALAMCASMAWDDDGCPAGTAVAFTAVGAAAGAGLGALVGALVAPMEWRPVALLEFRVAATGLPGGRIGIALSLRRDTPVR